MTTIKRCLSITLVAMSATVAQASGPDVPLVTVKVASHYPSANDVWALVTLDHSQGGCRPVMMNEFYLGSVSDRPLTLLSIEIVDAKGGQVARPKDYCDLRSSRFVPGQLMTLWCGVQYSWYVPLSAGTWAFALEGGRYRLRARVENRMEAYFRQHPKELRRVAAMIGEDEKKARTLLRDFSVLSNEVEFEVAGQ